MICYDDAGRAGSGLKERLDCTVRAYALFYGVPYREAHGVFEALGRRPCHKFYGHLSLKGVRLMKVSGTVGKLLKEIPKGRVLVMVRGHWFCAIDGRVHDLSRVPDRKLVRRAYVLDEVKP